ncbi:hypothetical protein ACFY8O_13435 [Streptomyces argenteolus]|uniref:LPXTG-motif cell wall-anchored protein n=1 Tax=Streptomyces argenteolus TaxID=67274 RepID=A0ABW6X6C8_9ACTN
MSLRPTLRTALLSAVTLGAVLLPAAAAVADGTPTPVPAERTATPAPTVSEPSEAATPVPAESVPPGTMPRGGVDAGERASGGTGDTALYGTVAGVAALAGGAYVLRRRSAAQR